MDSLPKTFADLQSGGYYLLGLKRHSGRTAETQKRLHNTGFQQGSIWNGIDGFFENIPDVCKKLGMPWLEFPESMGPGHIGCALSHISIWKHIVDQKLPYGLIFEDDALPHPEIQKLGPIWYNQTPRNVDMIFLGNQMNPDDYRIYDSNQKVIQSPCFCLHAYIITYDGAQRLLTLLESCPIDAIDKCIVSWQQKALFSWVCWNGTFLPRPYPVFHPSIQHSQEEPLIVYKRDNGLIYQDFWLGNTILSQNQILHYVKYN